MICICRQGGGYSGYSGYSLQRRSKSAHIAGMAADDDIPTCSLPPKRKGAKPKPRKRAAPDVPVGDVPKRKPAAKKATSAKSAQVGKPGKPSRAGMIKAEAEKAKDPFAGWDAKKEAAAARDSAIGKLKHKASVEISPKVTRKRTKEIVADEMDPGPVGGALARRRSTKVEVEDEIKAPTAREILARLRGGGKRPPCDGEIFEDVLSMIAAGIPLRQICRFPDMPTKDAIYKFLEDETDPTEHGRRLARYARARRLGFDEIAEEGLEIIDDGSNDYIERERDGVPEIVLDREHIQRSKLRFEGRMKLLAVWDPKRYGEMLKLGDPDASALGTGKKEQSISDMAIGVAKILEAHKRNSLPPPEDAEFTDVQAEA